MKITFNNQILDTPSENMNIFELLQWRNVSNAGTAVAINDRIVPRSKWESTVLSEDDRIVVISAAFGG